MVLRKKILIFFPDMGLGGVQRKIIDIINFLESANDIEISLVYRDCKEFSFLNQIRNPRCCLYQLPSLSYSKKIVKVVHLFYFIKYVFGWKPDVIFTFLQFNLPYVIMARFFLIFRFKRAKIVVSNDNILSLYNKRPHLNTVLPTWLLSKLFFLVDIVIVQTKYAKKDLFLHYKVPNDKIQVIPNWGPFLLPQFKKTTKKFDLIFSGRFVRQKRIERIIQLTELLTIKNKKMKVLLVGTGIEEDMLRLVVKQKKLSQHIIFKKPAQNILKLLSQSRIMILTSDFEGHPMILLEAMAMGLPSVVLNYPGLKEYFSDSMTGYIGEDLQEMKRNIEFLLNNAQFRNQFGKNARQEIKQRYNKDLIKKTASVICTSSAILDF